MVNPVICASTIMVVCQANGSDAVTALAKEAFKQGKSVRQLAYETVVSTKDNAGKKITKKDIDSDLNLLSMTLPGGEGAAGEGGKNLLNVALSRHHFTRPC